MKAVMYGLCLVCALALLAAVTVGQDVHRWKLQDYPDPFSFDTYSLCGRFNKSNICDPNNTISRQQADRIDSLIRNVYETSRCKCPSCLQNSHGYVIRVAIMPRIAPIYKKPNGSNANLEDAEMYSYLLTRKWAMSGSCNESLLILYSRYDGILYTLTLPGVTKVLDQSKITRIHMAVRHWFDNEDNVANGLEDMIQRYKLVFDGQEELALRPKSARARANDASLLSASAVSLLLPLLLWTLHR